jgi:hypothetical protein
MAAAVNTVLGQFFFGRGLGAKFLTHTSTAALPRPETQAAAATGRRGGLMGTFVNEPVAVPG